MEFIRENLSVFITGIFILIILVFIAFIPTIYGKFALWSVNRDIDFECEHHWYISDKTDKFYSLYCPICESDRLVYVSEWNKSMIRDSYSAEVDK